MSRFDMEPKKEHQTFLQRWKAECGDLSMYEAGQAVKRINGRLAPKQGLTRAEVAKIHNLERKLKRETKQAVATGAATIAPGSRVIVRDNLNDCACGEDGLCEKHEVKPGWTDGMEYRVGVGWRCPTCCCSFGLTGKAPKGCYPRGRDTCAPHCKALAAQAKESAPTSQQVESIEGKLPDGTGYRLDYASGVMALAAPGERWNVFQLDGRGVWKLFPAEYGRGSVAGGQFPFIPPADVEGEYVLDGEARKWQVEEQTGIVVTLLCNGVPLLLIRKREIALVHRYHGGLLHKLTEDSVPVNAPSWPLRGTES